MKTGVTKAPLSPGSYELPTEAMLFEKGKFFLFHSAMSLGSKLTISPLLIASLTRSSFATDQSRV